MNTSRQTKIRSIVVLVVAAIFLELTTAVQYISTRRAITAQITEMAKHDLTSANRTFEVKEIAEAAIAAVLPEVERFIDTQQQDSLHMALQRVVANHPEMSALILLTEWGATVFAMDTLLLKMMQPTKLRTPLLGLIIRNALGTARACMATVPGANRT